MNCRTVLSWSAGLGIALWLCAGCYKPEKIVKYQPQDIIQGKGGASDNTPPRIIVLSPRTELTRGLAIAASRESVEIRGLVIDDRRVSGFTVNNTDVMLAEDGGFLHKARLHAGVNRFELAATDASGNRATATLNVEPARKPAPGAGQDVVAKMRVKPALWILSVGVSEYRNKRLNLKYADNDAVTLARLLKDHADKNMFRDVSAKTLVNSEATRANVLTAMTSYLGQAGPDDLIFVFLAGHGIRNVHTGSYYFLPYNADESNALYEGVKWSDFDEAIRVLSRNVDKIVVVLDTCHAGAAGSGTRAVETGEDLSTALSAAKGLYVLSASKAGEQSTEDARFRLAGEGQGHGAFTYALLKGLKGEANYDKNGFLSVNELFSYVAVQVPRLTNGRQHPHSRIEGTDLPLIPAR